LFIAYLSSFISAAAFSYTKKTFTQISFASR